MEKKGQRILVIDDDPDIGMMLKLMLEYKGYSAVVADSAEKAEQALPENEISLIIMDMLLSGTNGTDLCAKFKSQPATRHIPVLMISAHPNAKELCFEAGADEFVLKPFDMNDILSRVAELLRIPS